MARTLTDISGPYDAVVEEYFPPDAVSNRVAFYDAKEDAALYKEREKIMIESCMRFIDFDKLDCIPMSEYIMA